MAQKVTAIVKLQIPAGKATPAPPVGSALGPHGINIMGFTKEFNERTKNGISPIVFTYEKTVGDILQNVLQNTILEGRPAQYGDIAVLCRRNFDLDRIASELKSEGSHPLFRAQPQK